MFNTLAHLGTPGSYNLTDAIRGILLCLRPLCLGGKRHDDSSDLFLSGHAEDVRQALQAGFAAAMILPGAQHRPDGEQLRIAVSRRQPRQPIIDLLSVTQQVEYIPLGSCSLKSCLVAEGKADCYLRLGPTGEWDTGAVHVIVEEAGGKILDSQFAPLSYNQRETLANPDFMVIGQAAAPWSDLIRAKSTTRIL